MANVNTQFSAIIAKFAKDALAKAEAIRIYSIEEFFGNIIKDTPVDTGKLTANWLTSQNSPNLTNFFWGNGKRDNPDSDRAGFKTMAIGVALNNVRANLGNGLKTDTSTFLANSAVGQEGESYGWMAEYGYASYGWMGDGRSPPSKNVMSSGFSRHAPQGMVRRNVVKFPSIVKAAIAKANT